MSTQTIGLNNMINKYLVVLLIKMYMYGEPSSVFYLCFLSLCGHKKESDNKYQTNLFIASFFY